MASTSDTQANMKTGSIKVHTADIFPIIKKWLYSEHDIFLRELVSNASDAITKRATWARTENQAVPSARIEVRVNKTLKTIAITDNGIGMTEAEVEKYIAQLAFSGAEEFVQKMKAQGKDAKDEVIGKFGLGFYSAFMVAERVEIDSLSMQAGAQPVGWSCEGDTEYSFHPSHRSEVGTTVTLHINKENEEFLQKYKLITTLEKFCSFMPYPIFVIDEEEAPVKPYKEDGSIDETAEALPVEPTLINENEPLWKKDPSQLKDEDYKAFFGQLFPMEPTPLFWIHLKIDHPFTLEGILYFPKFNPAKPMQDKNIKLYSKQVFVSDNVKNIIPEFLSLLKGCIDSTDIPLNVSRSSLQGDPNIRKISNYIIKKVADALKTLFTKDRARFEEIWGDIGLFVKYGIVSDNKFDEYMRERVIFKNADQKYLTLSEYRDSIPEAYKTKMGDKVLYFEKEKSNQALRNQLKSAGVHSIETDDHIDPHFMQHVESHKQGDKSYKFSSIDSEIGEVLETENTTDQDIKIKDLFGQYLTPNKPSEEEKKKNPFGDAGIDIEIQKVKNASYAAYFKVDEQMKRFQKMTQSMGQAATFPVKKTLVINPSNPLIQNVLKLHEKGNSQALVEKICHYVEDMAQISAEGLKQEEKDQFIHRGQELIQELTSRML